jgi:hypothetical protein
VEEHEHEYTHSYYPLETKELTLNEQNFIWNAQEGAQDACAAAINAGIVDVDVQDQWGSTALMHAVNKKHTSLVRPERRAGIAGSGSKSEQFETHATFNADRLWVYMHCVSVCCVGSLPVV